MGVALARRREVWVPTVWGWLALFVLCAGLGVLAAKNLYSWLAINEPIGAPVLVVEGWMGPPELEEVVQRFRAGGYQRIVTTGGPIHRRGWRFSPDETYAHQAADYLMYRGIPASVIGIAPSPITPEDRTFHAALSVAKWAGQAGITLSAIDLASEGPHARRSRLLYQLALGPDVKVGVLATRPHDYEAERWWRSSSGAKDVFEQAMGAVWVRCFFNRERYLGDPRLNGVRPHFSHLELRR